VTCQSLSVRVREHLALGGFAVLAGALVVGWRLGIPNEARGHLLGAYAVQWVAFGVAVTAVRGMAPRRAVPAILAGGALLQLLAVCWPPRTTDDFYRYIWDGRVQAAGIDPYRYAPTDPALAALRDGYLFPGGQPRLNHPGVHTIYPPTAQAYFAVLHYAPGETAKPLQVAAALLAIGVSALLVFTLRRQGRDPRAAAWWAWCPTVVLEAGNDAHVDVLGAFLLLAAFHLLVGRSSGMPHPVLGRSSEIGAGILLGAAVGVKFLPALVGPALVRHPRRWAIAGAAAGLLALAYLPHILAVGPGVFGFLGGYLGEEQYAGAARYPLAGSPLVAVLILVVTAGLVAWRADPAAPASGAATMVGVTFVVVCPEYPWYALLLAVLAALADRPRWLAVVAAAWPPYLVGALHWDHTLTRALSYGSAALVVLAASRHAARRSDQHGVKLHGRFRERGGAGGEDRPGRARAARTG
jgi:Glycosyltransferase family 87